MDAATGEWTLWLWLGLGVLALLVAWWLHLVFWVRRLAVPMRYHEVLPLEAGDGGRFVLRRLLSPERVDVTRPPVLLVHGVAANHRNLDAHPQVSLARMLGERGRDVWLLTLRSGLPRRERRKVRVRFDAMARHDVPEAIAAVLERTGAGRLDYVGFSMGGMLLYAALGSAALDQGRLRRAVIIGSPARVLSPLPGLRFLARLPRWLVPTFPLRLAARSYAFAADWLRTPWHALVYNHEHLAPGHAPAALVNVIEDVPASLNADLAEQLVHGEVRAGGERVIDRLAEVEVPALFLAGAADRIAPPEAVEAGFEVWGAEQDTPKRFEVIGKAQGASGDYGHGDLAVGQTAREEVFPRVVAFLDEAGAPPRGGAS
ncbi:MAG TPA: alpha/beta fold hydrolase [Polyangiaceae bacterium LLY-WYZ-15_(1-7)]|nr:alpha/beta fold hydrolase [Polyangiaceae bacterium LLY-WYZ-15_(1-7)]HJL01143.1 alpha/beta fold hydrolase [Polyangiaceae bacterium LLY-WYZ-15_(1-7)]HJL09994.1 alpha/beta fold hydrolase [Polyangiaceae bacterium LLY-WYZ-15_(1-7)]HJL37994.1 alpha/beta fold hydrolase [Polyangiaceae bacterium LLY-WYZ-15_(1-7)]